MNKDRLAHEPPLVLNGEVSVSTPVSYNFHFKPYGWAIFTINDRTGEFSIQSDWGTYGYRWSTARGAIGNRTLTQFLLSCDTDYIVRKFSMENRGELARQVCVQRTEEALKKHICEARRSGDLKKDAAREHWDDVVSWSEHSFSMESCPDALYTFLSEPWEYLEEDYPHRFYFLRDRLLPYFFQWLRNHLTNGDAPMPLVTGVLSA